MMGQGRPQKKRSDQYQGEESSLRDDTQVWDSVTSLSAISTNNR